MTQPRALFKREERDNLLYEMGMDVRELHTKLDNIIANHVACQKAMIRNLERIEDDHERLKTNMAKGGVAVGLALVAGIFGMIA